jgi:hypothetical protein
VHYAAVTWLQYSLLSVALPGLAKGALVFVGGTAASWCLIAALRRFRPVRRVV